MLKRIITAFFNNLFRKGKRVQKHNTKVLNMKCYVYIYRKILTLIFYVSDTITMWKCIHFTHTIQNVESQILINLAKN